MRHLGLGGLGLAIHRTGPNFGAGLFLLLPEVQASFITRFIVVSMHALTNQQYIALTMGPTECFDMVNNVHGRAYDVSYMYVFNGKLRIW